MNKPGDTNELVATWEKYIARHGRRLGGEPEAFRKAYSLSLIHI